MHICLEVIKRCRTYKPVPRRDLSKICGFGKENVEEIACGKIDPAKGHTVKQLKQAAAPPCKRRKVDIPASFEPTEGGAKEVGGRHTQAIRDQYQAALYPAKRRQPRKRILVNHSAAAVQQAEPQTEYERQRAERIKRNAAVLEALALKQLAGDFAAGVQQAEAARTGTTTRPPRKPRERAPRASVADLPARQSRRIRGGQPGEVGGEGPNPASLDEAECSGECALMDLKEYFKWKGMAVSGVEVDGHFRGWVNPAISEQYGIAGSAEDAWEQNGGGKFIFKIDKSAIPANLKGKGWSDARAFSATMLKKNPNTYFYRHVAPHEQQAQGDWTEEEHELFMQTAKQHGAGDKWGLFASYIPQRVGYQCSAHYREVAIPQGLIYDPNFQMTRNGKAVYVG